ncbi:MAG: T9SS C-terminal target domain-containing protein [Ignavibacteriales bacterium]|nr:MAG: T9SS C-terminal target domain-containing protein [Ignavibacteriales bacterium]
MLAKEVAQLVNTTQESGRYEATFDGSNLPSGAYFYKLKAGNYIEVKKLLLVK